MGRQPVPNDGFDPASLAKGAAAAVDHAQNLRAPGQPWTIIDWAQLMGALALGSVVMLFRSWRDYPERPRSHVLIELVPTLILMVAGYWAASDLGYPPGVAAAVCVAVGLLGINELRNILKRRGGGHG